ncbi:MAG: hypothetical protein ACYTEQ_05360 [Planctomycetota bacterium]
MSLEEAHAAVPNLSRMFAWWNARNMMDPPQHHNSNSGSYNRLVMECIARFGLPTEEEWPYDPWMATTRPSISAQRDAYHRRSSAFHKIYEDNSKRVDSIVTALTNGPCVMFGTVVGEELCGAACSKMLELAAPDGGVGCEEGLPVPAPPGAGNVPCVDGGPPECISCEAFCVQQHENGIHWGTKCISEDISTCVEIESVCNIQ